MIYLQQDKVNTVALTLSENEAVGASSSYFLMDIKNLYSLEEIKDVKIYETNADVTRFNRFLMELIYDVVTEVRWKVDDTGDFPVTVLYDIEAGFWSYTAKNVSGTTLEIGTLLVEDRLTEKSEYTPN